MKKIVILCFLLLTACALNAQKVNVSGAMKNVMWKGELAGTILLDTLKDKQYLVGLGPVEYLSGELLVFGGKAYKSIVVNDSVMNVEESFREKAPFFVYSFVKKWKEYSVPDSVRTQLQLEQYLTGVFGKSKDPFAFKLDCVVDSADIHIVNLAPGSSVSSPDDAHRGQKNFKVKNEPCDLIGFFSTKHKAVFTHHDTFVHIHLITKNRLSMGHLEQVVFKKGSVKLYLPEK